MREGMIGVLGLLYLATAAFLISEAAALKTELARARELIQAVGDLQPETLAAAEKWLEIPAEERR